MKVILISGYSNSRKGDIANMFKATMNLAGESAVVLSLAAGVKASASSITGTPVAELDKYKNSSNKITSWGSKPCTVRTLYENLGTTLRSINPNILITRVLDDIRISRSRYSVCIVKDVRLLHELSMLYMADAYVTHVHVSSPKSEALMPDSVRFSFMERDNVELMAKAEHVIVNNYDPKTSSVLPPDVQTQVNSVIGGSIGQ